MLTVYNCIVNEHDLRLVALAALICGISCFSAVNLLRHVDQSTSRNRHAWLLIAAASTGRRPLVDRTRPEQQPSSMPDREHAHQRGAP